MAKNGLFWRIFGAFVLLSLLVTAVAGTLVSRSMHRLARQDTLDTLRMQTVMLCELSAPLLLRAYQMSDSETGQSNLSDFAELQTALQAIAAEGQARFTVILPNGTVVADTDEDPARMGDHSPRPEIRAALTQGIGHAERYSRTLNSIMSYVALPVRSDGMTVGVARVALSSERIDESLAAVRDGILISALAALLFALVAGWLFARRIARPIQEITSAVEAMAAGTDTIRLHVRSDDEIGALARTFNHMHDELERRLALITKDRNEIVAILAAMRDGVVAVASDDRIMHMNAAAAGMFGLTSVESLDRPYWESIRISEVCDVLAESLRRQRGSVRELQIPSVGADRIIEMQTSILQAGPGEIAGVVLVLHDLTRLRQLESVRRDFVSNVSHELKTPLTAIRGLVESILDDADMNTPTRLRFLTRVKEQADRLGNLVTDLLDLSRYERDRSPIVRQDVDARGPLEKSIESLMAAASEKGLSLAFDLGEESLRVSADAESLTRIFDNLLTNAIRYTPEGGSIEVRAAAVGDCVVLEVQDTGIGIDAVHLERIFERFYRTDKARSREQGGTGLGLAIVKHIVLNLGGSVEVESRPDAGSLFRVKLPLTGHPPIDPNGH
jgi:two-component system phosphate regulon sensor histidine kinase PhoR